MIVNGGEAGEEIAMRLQRCSDKPENWRQRSAFIAFFGGGDGGHWASAALFATLRQHDVPVVRAVPFADHQAYHEADLLALTPNKEALLMTERMR